MSDTNNEMESEEQNKTLLKGKSNVREKERTSTRRHGELNVGGAEGTSSSGGVSGVGNINPIRQAGPGEESLTTGIAPSLRSKGVKEVVISMDEGTEGSGRTSKSPTKNLLAQAKEKIVGEEEKGVKKHEEHYAVNIEGGKTSDPSGDNNVTTEKSDKMSSKDLTPGAKAVGGEKGEEGRGGSGTPPKIPLTLSLSSSKNVSSSAESQGANGVCDNSVAGGSSDEMKKLLARGSTSGASPVRGSRTIVTEEPLVEEDGEEVIMNPTGRRSSTGRSGSAGALSAGGFPVHKRASLKCHPGKKLIRRSSFLVDTACSRSHAMNAAIKPQEPVPPPVVQQTRRCSLTLPYPNLYGSWQAAAAMTSSSSIVKSNSNEMHPTSHHHHGPPPLLKRKSFAHFEMSYNSGTSSTPGTSNIRAGAHEFFGILTHSNFRRVARQTTSGPQPGPLTAKSTSVLEPSPEEEPQDLPPSSTRASHLSQSKTVTIGEQQIQQEILDESDETQEKMEEEDEDEVDYQVEPYLLATHLQKLPLKDFVSEVRASMDIEHFLHKAVLLLNVTDSSLENIVDLMLSSVFKLNKEPLSSVQQVKSSLFAHDSVHLLARTIQGTSGIEGSTFDYDPTWICAICNLPSLQRRHVAIARLTHPANFGRTSEAVRIFILVLCPSKEKGTKNSLETGRTFATLFADVDFREELLKAHSEEEFKRLILQQAHELSQEDIIEEENETQALDSITDNHADMALDNQEPDPGDHKDEPPKESWIQFGQGIKDDFKRRWPFYVSDYVDGIVGYRTVHKTVSTTFFLYFACILPAIAFGVLNDHTTNGLIDVKKVIVGQTMGELFYVILSGQPINILLTTAPLCLFVKILYALAEDFQVDFEALYCCVGLWSCLFTGLYALFDVSRLMRWSTRSTEEIFALFISIAFSVDAFRDTVKNFKDNYAGSGCPNATDEADKNMSAIASYVVSNITNDADFSPIGKNGTQLMSMALSLISNVTTDSTLECRRDSSILFLLLMLGTLWLGVTLYNFNKTPYLQASKREALADYSLPVAVVALSFIGSYVFRDIRLERFKYDDNNVFRIASMSKISWTVVFASGGLGFSLSLLIFMDQNITSAMVNNPCNKLKKGPAFHWDLMIVAIINGFLSIFTFPWMHATLPHSPLHMRSLADVEERVDQGHVYEIIVRVRETRLTGIFSHILIGFSIYLLPYPLGYIPIAVLDGLFLYMAVTALNGNQMFERITLLFMEQAAYPPNHYIRRVPQRKIHQFTFFQVLQLFVMCVVGFVPWPYVKMVFPITLLLLLPIRHKVVPLLIEQKYLEALDGEHP